MTRDEIIAGMLEAKVIAIARGLNQSQAVKAAEALYKGGIRFMEVTFDATGKTSDEQTGEKIKAIAEAMDGKMSVGAGTVQSIKQVEITKSVGGEFIISPDMNPDVIKRTLELGMVSIPGALTPTEALTAHKCGADFIKIFPAGNLGASYIKAIRAPLSNIRIMAVGGISDANIGEYIAAGCVGAGVGGNLVNVKAIEAGDYDSITEVARRTVEAVK